MRKNYKNTSKIAIKENMKTKLFTICLLSLTILAGCSSSSCDDSKSTDQWHDCSGTYIEKGVGTYSGEWKHGEWNGQGAVTFASGAKHVGGYKNDKRHGHGTYTYANGNKYVGEYKDVKKHGHGTYTYASGAKYAGGLKNNKKHGHGTYTFANGDKEVGQWENDKYVGK